MDTNASDSSILQDASNILFSGPTSFLQATHLTLNIHHPDEQNVQSDEIAQDQAQKQRPIHIRLDQSRKIAASVYRNQLKKRVNGHALWIPGPNRNMPKEYRKLGALIGDVGIFTAEGAWDPLFNICRESSDPVNPRQLPPGFCTLHLPDQCVDIRKYDEYGKGSYVSSTSVSQVQGGTSKNFGMIFESRATEGAILMMPEGAMQEELCNLPPFRDYIKCNAESIYEYVNNTRGREVSNGQVHVIYGTRKASSWGMATFSDAVEESNLRIKFESQILNTSSDPAYVWTHDGSADVKVGPYLDEHKDLLEMVEDGNNIQNQCLFASTISIHLSEKLWEQRFSKRGKITNKSQYSSPPAGSQNIASSLSHSSLIGNNFINPLVVGGLGAEDSLTQHDERSTNLSNMSSSTTSQVSTSSSEHEDIMLEWSSPSSAAIDTADILAEFLLTQVPSATVAVVCNKDWSMCTWDAEDPASLIDAVCAANHIYGYTGGVAYFERRESDTFSDRKKSIVNSFCASTETAPEEFLFGTCGNCEDYLHQIAQDLQEMSSEKKDPTRGATEKFCITYPPHRILSLNAIRDAVRDRAKDRAAHADLWLSVEDWRRLLQRTPPGHKYYAYRVAHLAKGLLNRFYFSKELNDLHETIWYLECALFKNPATHYRHLELLLDLLACFNYRYERLGRDTDLHNSLLCIQRIRDLDIRGLLDSIRSHIYRVTKGPRFNQSLKRDYAHKTLAHYPAASSQSSSLVTTSASMVTNRPIVKRVDEGDNSRKTSAPPRASNRAAIPHIPDYQVPNIVISTYQSSSEGSALQMIPTSLEEVVSDHPLTTPYAPDRSSSLKKPQPGTPSQKR